MTNKTHPGTALSVPNRTEINIALNDYSDLFSDFDPSAYSEKTVSDDFIIQAKQISKTKSGDNMLLRFLLPAGRRDEKDEKVIIERLGSYFINGYKQLKSDIRKANVKGAILVFTGAVLMIAASYISFMKPDKYHVHLLLVLLEPAGWFLLWVGLDHLVYSLKAIKKEIAFYSKMTKTEITFSNNQIEIR